MPTHLVSQQRTGEGAFLLHVSSQPAERLPDVLPELFDGVLLVASADLTAAERSRGRELAPGLWTFSGADARQVMARAGRWGRRDARFGTRSELPDQEQLGRCIPDPARPWDHERLGLSAYGELGGLRARAGTCFADELHRRRWIEAAVASWMGVEPAGLPNGDVTLVLDLLPETTFRARFKTRGRGGSLRVRRDFAEAGITRRWWVRDGEWMGEEERRPAGGERRLLPAVAQWAASAGILLLSLPVAALLLLVLATTKLVDVSSTGRRAA